jgi:hypothetical protein
MTGTITPRRGRPADHGPAKRSAPADVAIDPRIVRRREQVAAQVRRRRGRVVLLAVFTVVVVAALVVALRSPLLDVEDVVVTGTDRAEEVRRAGGVSPGDALVEVDAAEVRRRLMDLPWVASARVRVDWPRSVQVRVREEPPVAVLAPAEGAGGDDRSLVVGRGGRVVARVGDAGFGSEDLRGVTRVGVAAWFPAGAPEPGQVLADPLRDVVVVVEQTPVELRRELSRARTDRAGNLSFELPDGGTVRFGPVEEVPAKLLSVRTVLGGRVERRCLDVVDVREPLRPTVSRRDGCSLPPPTTGGGSDG